MGPTLRGPRPLLLAALFCVTGLAWGRPASQAQVDPFDSPLRLELLKQYLTADGLDDINFLVVNSGGWQSRRQAHELQNRVSFPVYEEGYVFSIWETLYGGKDDILVYDRCGFLTYQVRMPYSFLNYPYVESTIRVTYHGDDPCDCNIGESQVTSMAPSTTDGGQMMERNGTVATEKNGSESTNSSSEVEVTGNNTASLACEQCNTTEVDFDANVTMDSSLEDEGANSGNDTVLSSPSTTDKLSNMTEVDRNQLKKSHEHHGKHYNKEE